MPIFIIAMGAIEADAAIVGGSLVVAIANATGRITIADVIAIGLIVSVLPIGVDAQA